MSNHKIIYFLSALYLAFISCTPIIKVQNINKVYVYNKFLLNGSTNNILNAFVFPNERKIDTSQNDKINLDIGSLSKSLENSNRPKRHHQQKLGGTTFAGEFYDNLNKKHFFVYYEEPKLLIDFTDKIQYWLKDKLIY